MANLRSDTQFPNEVVQAYNELLAGVRQVNEALDKLRAARCASTIRDHGGRWYADVKLIITSDRT